MRESCFLLALVLAMAGQFTGNAAEPKEGRSLTFLETEFLHRWSMNDQHEFTPRGQEDLERWEDMITLNYYRDAKDGDALAKIANAVLENYKTHGAKVLRTSSVPRTPNRPAEHLIVVVFTRPELAEVVFTRLKLVGGVGTAAIYSHREYGGNLGERVNTWLQKKGSTVEKALMSWGAIPAQGSPELQRLTK